MSKKRQALWIGYFILAASLMLVGPYFLPKVPEPLSYSQFKLLLKHGQLTEVVVHDKAINGAMKVEGIKEVFSPEKIKELGDRAKGPLPFVVVRVEDARLTAELEEAGIPFKGETTSDWLSVALAWLMPIIVFFALWGLLFNRIGGTGGGLMQIG